MQDEPTPVEILAAVADFLRQSALPQMQEDTVFHMRVSINALELVRRQLELAPQSDAAEQARLRVLLGRDGPLQELNRDLAGRIARGEMTVETPGLLDHLWASTMEKLAVDQPNYASYRRALARRSTDPAKHTGRPEARESGP
jgi:Domain of unknown function (DUF6285)